MEAGRRRCRGGQPVFSRRRRQPEQEITRLLALKPTRLLSANQGGATLRVGEQRVRPAVCVVRHLFRSAGRCQCRPADRADRSPQRSAGPAPGGLWVGAGNLLKGTVPNASWGPKWDAEGEGVISIQVD